MSRDEATPIDEIDDDEDDTEDLTLDQMRDFADEVMRSLEHACALASLLTGLPPEFFLPPQEDDSSN